MAHLYNGPVPCGNSGTLASDLPRVPAGAVELGVDAIAAGNESGAGDRSRSSSSSCTGGGTKSTLDAKDAAEGTSNGCCCPNASTAVSQAGVWLWMEPREWLPEKPVVVSLLARSRTMDFACAASSTCSGSTGGAIAGGRPANTEPSAGGTMSLVSLLGEVSLRTTVWGALGNMEACGVTVARGPIGWMPAMGGLLLMQR
mmetsp:Transcript_44178/g.94100  ORF Transcript_44178/g.94100 Transcript_44178/m.94100 type:complete len:200 (+) Transcript_44178:204-803(+)